MVIRVLSSSFSSPTELDLGAVLKHDRIKILTRALHLKDVARKKDGLPLSLACITGEVSPDGDSTLSIGSRGEATWGTGPRLPHLVDTLVLLTFSTIQLVTMSQPWGPWILA